MTTHGPEDLHPELHAWAREKGWSNFRPLQKQAFEQILRTNSDVVICGPMASGKTEAAFLPLISQSIRRRRRGASVLCIVPTKALINDQYRRLVPLAERVRLPLIKWHGEAPGTQKRRLINERRGIVLITNESLEGRLIRSPNGVRALFGSLDAIVIDEFHEFMSGPRGHQLACQLARLDQLSGYRPRRIALSATLGDADYSRRWLNPANPQSVAVLAEAGEERRFLSAIRGYVSPEEDRLPSQVSCKVASARPAIEDMADYFFETHRGRTNIIFATSKRIVEQLCGALARRAEVRRVKNEFVPYHGSLARGMREPVEDRMRQGNEALTPVATSALEVGIDMQAVDAVAQIEAPRSMTSFRQRVGRSGRRGAPPIVSVHVTEKPDSQLLSLMDRLRLNTVRAVAAINLLEQRFVEPPEPDGSILSVLFQQTLSVIKQRRGVSYSELLRLVRSVSPFSRVQARTYTKLVRAMAKEHGLLEAGEMGKLVLTAKGESLAESYEFFAAFQTNLVWDIYSGEQKLGAIPFSNPVAIGHFISFAGRKWAIISVSEQERRLNVEPSREGRLPYFDLQQPEQVDPRVAREMLNVLQNQDVPPDLDATAAKHLREGRGTFSSAGLEVTSLVQDRDDCHVFTWAGTKLNCLLALLIRYKGLPCGFNEVAVTVASAEVEEVRSLLGSDLPTIPELASTVTALRSAKYDRLIPVELLRSDWIARYGSSELPLHDLCSTVAALSRQDRGVVAAIA